MLANIAPINPLGFLLLKQLGFSSRTFSHSEMFYIIDILDTEDVCQRPTVFFFTNCPPFIPLQWWDLWSEIILGSRFSQSVGGPRCQSVLSTVASPASRGPEAAGWRKGGGGAGGQKIDLLLSQTLSFPFTNCVKHNQVGRLHTTQLILLYSCNWASQVHNHRNTLLWSLVVGGDYISQSC